MILFKEKRYPKIEPHKWFAWYPVWAWENQEHENLNFVWLQKVWRTNGRTVKYRYYLTNPQNK